MSPYSAPGIEGESYIFPIESFECNIDSNALSLYAIQYQIERFYNLPKDSLKKDTRKREIVQGRQIAMKLSREMIKAPLNTIGSHFADRDHASVLYAIKTVNNLLETDKKFRAQLEEIERRLKG